METLSVKLKVQNFERITKSRNKINTATAIQKPDISQLQISDDGPPNGSSHISSQQDNSAPEKVIKVDMAILCYDKLQYAGVVKNIEADIKSVLFMDLTGDKFFCSRTEEWKVCYWQKKISLPSINVKPYQLDILANSLSRIMEI